jgi:hypothetical protein
VEAHELKRLGMNHSAIARKLGIRRPTIVQWLSQESYADDRGWTEGIKRSHTSSEEERIVALKQKRIDEKRFFLGSPYIQMDYAKQFPTDPLPSLWFFDDVTRRNGLQTHEPKKRTKGQNIVSRLKFPIASIIGLGKIQQSVDFIGKKYIHGSRDPVSIFATSFYQWLGLYQIARVLAETVECAIEELTSFWTEFPLSNVLRMDNAMTFRGGGRARPASGNF